MKRRLSPRAGTVAAAGGILFLAGTTAQAGWLFVLAAGVIGLVAGSLLVGQNLKAARVTRLVPVRARVGDEVRVGIEIASTSKRKLPLMRVTDHFPAFQPAVSVAERLSTGATNHIEQVRTALKRGRYENGPVVLRAGTPFGFMWTSRTIEVPSPTVVVPRWVDLTSFPILEPSSIPFDVLHERARTGAGEEYLGVRDYRPGDPPRAVHWRTTARAGHLVVREFEEEVASKVSIVIGGADSGQAPDSSYEVLVSAAASIAIYAFQTGHPVELSRYDSEGITRIAGPDRYAVLDWLAGAEASDRPLAGLVGDALARIGRRGTVVVCAPTLGAAGADLSPAVRMVQQAGSRAIVVAARSSTWGATGVDDESALLARLQSRRVSVRDISSGDDLYRCLMSLGAS